MNWRLVVHNFELGSTSDKVHEVVNFVGFSAKSFGAGWSSTGRTNARHQSSLTLNIDIAKAGNFGSD